MYMKSEGKRVALNSIFIILTGGTFLVPHIETVKIHSTDTDSGLAVIETIIP